MEPEKVNFLRAVKGVPLSILFAMLFEGHEVGRDYLVRVTGWGKDKVTEGLRTLEDLGYIESPSHKRYNGWVLSSKIHQFHIFDDEILDHMLESTKAINSPLETTTTALIVSEKNMRKNSSRNALEGDNFALVENDGRRKNLALLALHSWGIMGKTATELSERDYITFDYVNYHGRKAQSDGIRTGLLVTRLRDHDPIIEILNSPGDDDPRRYINGNLAEFIKH